MFNDYTNIHLEMRDDGMTGSNDIITSYHCGFFLDLSREIDTKRKNKNYPFTIRAPTAIEVS